MPDHEDAAYFLEEDLGRYDWEEDGASMEQTQILAFCPH
jgi:hypothetical protein